MAVIQNIINTIFNTSGDRDAENAANRVGRAQTRLAQTSAAAGRGFAAQSQGLGGLVGAYAGAAATTFALSAAFDALARSARAAQTLEGLTAIASSSAIAGQELLKSVKDITKGQLSLVESAEQINLSLSAGFDTSQIEGLAKVSLQASRALGRDLSDSFTRVVRGSAKLETELLDELGIYTKIEPATQAYAAAIGTTASKLTEFQRRQAFVNSVIAEGNRKFSSINTTIPSSAEKIEAFAKTISDLVTKIGVFIADSVAPLAEFLTENLAGSLAVLAIAGSLVFGKLFAELNNFAKGVQKRGAEIQNNIQNKIIDSFGRTAQAARDAGQAAAKSLDLRPDALSRDSRSELSSLRNLANQRTLTNDELRRANTLLSQRAQLLTGKRAALAQEIKDQRAIARNTAASNAERAAAAQRLDVLRNSLTRLQSVTRANTAAMNSLTAATTGATASFARLSASALAGLVAIGAGLARLVTGFITFSSLAIGAVSIFALLTAGVFSATGRTEELNAFLKEVGSAIKGISGQAERIKNRKVFQGLVGGALQEMEQTNKELKDIDSFTFKKKVFGIEVEVEKTKEQVVSDVSKLLTEISTGSLQTSGERIGTVLGSAAGAAVTGAIAGSFAGLPTAIGGAVVGGIVGGVGALIATSGRTVVAESETAYQNVLVKFNSALAGITDDATRQNITQALAQYEKQYGELAKFNPEVRALLDTFQELVLRSAQFADNVSEISRITKATGESSDAIAANYRDFESIVAGVSNTITEIAGVEIPVSFITDDIQEQSQLFGRDLANAEQRIVDSLDSRTINSVGRLQEVARTYITAVETVKGSIEDVQREAAAGSGLSLSDFMELNNLLATMGITFKDIAEGRIKIFEGLPEEASKTANAILINNKVLRELDAGVRSGAISFEQFEQGISAARSGVQTLTIETIGLATELREALNDPTSTKAYKDALVEAYNTAKAGLEAQKQVLSILEAQTGQYKAQAAISEFIKSLKIDEISTLEFELALNTAGLEDPLLARVTYINDAIGQLESKVGKYNATVAEASNLTEQGKQLAPTLAFTTADEALDAAKALDRLEGVEAKAVGTTVTYTNLLDGTTGALNGLTKESIEAATAQGKLKDALANLSKQGFIETTGAIKEQISALNDLTKENNKAVKDIDIETANIKFSASLDVKAIKRDINLIKAEAQLDSLELELDIVKARESSGALNPLQAALKENSLQQAILDKRKALIELERNNAFAALGDEIARTTRERDQELKLISIKQKADKDQAILTRDTLLQQANIYAAFLDGQQVVNNDLETTILDSGQKFVDAIAKTFDLVNDGITQAILAGYEKAPEPDQIPAVQVDSAAADSNVASKTLADLKKGINDSTDAYIASVDDRASAESDRVRAVADASLARIGADLSRVIAESNAALAQLKQQAVIEGDTSLVRVLDALEDITSETVAQAESDLDTLNDIIKDANAAVQDLQEKELIAKLQFEVDMAELDQQLDIAKEQIALKQLELQVQLVQAKVGSKSLGKVEGATQENALQQKILDQRTVILQKELAAIETNRANQVKLIEQQRQLDIQAAGREFANIQTQIKAARDNANNLITIFRNNITAEQEVNQSLVSGLSSFANKFLAGLAQTFTAAAAAINTAALAGAARESASPTVGPVSIDAETLKTVSDSFKEITSTITTQADAAETAAKESLQQQISTINTTANQAIALENKRADIAKMNKQAEIDNQTTLGQIEDENAKRRLADAADSGGKSSAEKAADKMKEKLNAIFDGIASSINTAIMDFGNLLLYGPGEGETFGDKFRSIFSNLFKSIQQTLFQETIAKPASNFITEKLLGISKTGIENAKFDERGNLKVTVANWLAASVPGLSSKPKDKDEAGPITRLIDSLTSEDGLFGGIKKLFSSIFGEGGFFSNLFSSIGALFSGGGAGGGGFFGTLFQGILSIFGMASGGTVHRAGGGSIPNVNTRDRVSALLEPGEFVIRKPMARQIGTPALQQLNATGQMSGGNVQVNITNEGTPQQAQASAPRFDGEKYVIDIVTRDLANNGPIRRSLRGDR